MLVCELQSILDIKINTVMNQDFKWCLLFRDLCLILTMFSGCCVWIPHNNGSWLAVCDIVTVVLVDIVLLAFEKILVLFSGHRKTAFLQLHKFLFTTAQFFYNCTICAQLHTKSPGILHLFTTLHSQYSTEILPPQTWWRIQSRWKRFGNRCYGTYRRTQKKSTHEKIHKTSLTWVGLELMKLLIGENVFIIRWMVRNLVVNGPSASAFRFAIRIESIRFT